MISNEFIAILISQILTYIEHELNILNCLYPSDCIPVHSGHLAKKYAHLALMQYLCLPEPKSSQRGIWVINFLSRGLLSIYMAFSHSAVIAMNSLAALHTNLTVYYSTYINLSRLTHESIQPHPLWAACTLVSLDPNIPCLPNLRINV